MKAWRTGTLSMGVTLIWIGITLLVAQFNGIGAFDAFMNWWPIVFVLLGLEVVIGLFFSRRQEGGRVQYDMLSICFVSLLYIGCLGFALLTGTGLMKEVRHLVNQTEVTLELPDVEENIPAEIKRIVLQVGNWPLKIDTSTVNKLHVFGTYQQMVGAERNSKLLSKDEFVSFRTIGDTMYVQTKHPPVQKGLRGSTRAMKLTAVVPNHIEVEVRDEYQQLVQPSLDGEN